MVSLLQIIENVTSILPNLRGLVMMVSLITGVAFVFFGIKAAAKRQEMGRHGGNWSGPLGMVGVGIAMIALPGLMQTLTLTFFGTATSPDPSAIFAYSPTTIGMLDASAPGGRMLTGIVSIVMFTGIIAIMRGLLLLNATAQGGGGPKTFGPGITFCIAGSMAVNFPLFVAMMEWFITTTS
ncbi:hypothetical protein ACEUZ9_002863 [Paracoccus litorisediminis]|uniref:hypothetical protein n=1 Tax=Paracoccus litorisediminis TaxID=2006130 RepID=UPI0037307CD3